MTAEHNTWSVIRIDTIERFAGQTPLPDDEALIIDVFEQHPQLVMRAIDEIAQALTDGKVTWAWGALRGRLQRGTTPLREATADTRGSTLKRLENARAWIRNAGIHYDLQRHIEAELFGDDYASGILSDITITDAQRNELIAYWQTQRPRGIKAEEDHEHWLKTCGGGPKRHKELLAQHKAKLDAQQEAAANEPLPTMAQTPSPQATPQSGTADARRTASVGSSSTQAVTDDIFAGID